MDADTIAAEIVRRIARFTLNVGVEAFADRAATFGIPGTQNKVDCGFGWFHHQLPSHTYYPLGSCVSPPGLRNSGLRSGRSGRWTGGRPGVIARVGTSGAAAGSEQCDQEWHAESAQREVAEEGRR